MKTRFTIAILLVFLVVGMCFALPSKEIYKQNLDKVCQIIVEMQFTDSKVPMQGLTIDWVGSGWVSNCSEIPDEDGNYVVYISTARHVLSINDIYGYIKANTNALKMMGYNVKPENLGAQVAITLKMGSGEKIKLSLNDVTLWTPQKVMDYGVLSFYSKRKFSAVATGDSTKLEVGDPVTVIASPHGIPSCLTEGIISNLSFDFIIEDEVLGKLDYRDTFIVTADISGGSSGGAVFDANGAVVGWVVAGSVECWNAPAAMKIGAVAGQKYKKMKSDIPE